MRLASLATSQGQRTLFGVAGGVPGPGDDAEDTVGVLGRNSLGQDVPISQNYGTSLGVDSGHGDAPALLDSYIDPVFGVVREGMKMRFDSDVTLNELHLFDLDVGERSTSRSAATSWDEIFDGNSPGKPTSTASKPFRSETGSFPRAPTCTSSTPAPRASVTRGSVSTA